jgi:hypothetical protein
MFSGYYYPYYRSFGYPVYPNPYGYSYGYPYGSNYSSNIVGSAISNQNLVNTGNAIGVNQISTPTVIW